MLTGSNLLLSQLVDDLAEHGWAQQNFFITQGLTLELAAECHRRATQDALRPAGIGHGSTQALREGVRGDRIEWLQADEPGPCKVYLEHMNALRVALNAALYLGLEDYESHFSLYPPGAFYHRHLDRFRDDDRRTVSAVLYLNQDWRPEYGGALRLYTPGQSLEITPLGGRLVVFLSAEIAHEVLPTTHERLSLTGWFRRRAQSV